MRLRLLTFAVVLLSGFCFAGSAQAATTFGVTMDGTPNAIPAGCQVVTLNVPVSCTLFLGSIANVAERAPAGLAAPADGVITRWRVSSGNHGATSLTLKPRVLRFTTMFQMIRSGTERAIPAAGGLLTFEDRLPVEKNDYLAIDSVANGPAGSGPPIVATIGSNANYVTKTPAVPDGETFSVTIVIGPPTQTKLMINADIEPDVDGDGYGDETQDKCVQRSDVHDACPPPVLSGKVLPGSNGFTINVDRAAKAQITLDRVTKGRKASKKCKKRARRGKRCNIFTKFAQWNEELVPGVNKLSYAYKVGGRKLRRGDYRATIVIISPENTSLVTTFRFKVKR